MKSCIRPRLPSSFFPPLPVAVPVPIPMRGRQQQRDPIQYAIYHELFIYWQRRRKKRREGAFFFFFPSCLRLASDTQRFFFFFPRPLNSGGGGGGGGGTPVRTFVKTSLFEPFSSFLIQHYYSFLQTRTTAKVFFFSEGSFSLFQRHTHEQNGRGVTVLRSNWKRGLLLHVISHSWLEGAMCVQTRFASGVDGSKQRKAKNLLK